MPTLNDYYNFRGDLVKALTEDLIGPSAPGKSWMTRLSPVTLLASFFPSAAAT